MADEKQAQPTNAATLEAVLKLDAKFDRLLSVATQCFEALQEVPLLRQEIKDLTLRVTVLERAARDTTPSPPP